MLEGKPKTISFKEYFKLVKLCIIQKEIGQTYGTIMWLLNGQLHREDGPAIEWFDGTKEWYLNGQLYRVDGSAIERSDGSKEWYQNDQRHREDGPVVECTDGTKNGSRVETNNI